MIYNQHDAWPGAKLTPPGMMGHWQNKTFAKAMMARYMVCLGLNWMRLRKNIVNDFTMQ